MESGDIADDKQTDDAMKRRMWIRRRQDDAFFGHRPRLLKFWDFVGGWFGMDTYYDSGHQ